MHFTDIPLCLFTDSYKVTHPFQYPDGIEKFVAYAEFRTSFDKDEKDHRIIYYGIRYILENYIAKQWKVQDVLMAEKFFSTHNAGNTSFPFPKDLFLKFIKENDGYFPVKIESLPEGSVVYPHVPVYVITAEKEYSKLVTYLETILTMVWYPSTVATLSRRCKEVIRAAFIETVDPENYFLLESRLHDFGFRGCTSNEQAVLGGTAHLLNFCGTDTMPAAFYAQFALNSGEPVGSSIPASEHSVMTSFKNEKEAILHMIKEFGDGYYSIVMDSYDYQHVLEQILPSIYSKKIEKSGFMVLRPDSGEPSAVVLMALNAAEKVFGVTMNSKGFKVLKGCGVIQGDGINYAQIQKILLEVKNSGFSAENVVFGMGGGLLQKVNRDTLSFATKLSYLETQNGERRNIIKMPKLDSNKFSLPGEFLVEMDTHPIVYPKEDHLNAENSLSVIYDKGPIKIEWPQFSLLKSQIEEQWLSFNPLHNPLSSQMKLKVERERNLSMHRLNE